MPENDDKQQQQQQPPKTERQGWDAEQLARESANKMPDEMEREVLRGDSTKGDADSRDAAGGPNSNETPQGREEAKPK